MNQLAIDYIKQYYVDKNLKMFKEKSSKTPEYFSELYNLTKSLCREQTICNSNNSPVLEIWIKFDDFVQDNFIVEYLSLLRISKVSDLFVIQHEFSVKNIDPNRMTPVLDGFGSEAYTLFQKNAEEEIYSFLLKQGLTKLNLHELDEVFGGLKLEEKNIFGTQMTLENALFMDLYGICET